MGPYESCHVLGISWSCSSHVIGYQWLIFDAFFLIFSWFFPDFFLIFFDFFRFFEMSVSWLVLVQFRIFLNPYGSLWVLPCPGHVLGTFKSCHRHPATQFCCVFFIFFQKITHLFYFFAKNIFFFWKNHYTPPCSDHFTWILLINFHILAINGHQTCSLQEILTPLVMTEIWP